MKLKLHLTIGACVAAITLVASAPAFAAPKKEASPSPTAAPKASASAAPTVASSASAKGPRAIPFHGTVASVDQAASTFTITGKTNSRVFKVSDKSKVMKSGAAGTLSDIAANETVGGSYWKQEDGTLEVKTVNIGGGAKSKKSAKMEDGGEASPASPAASPKK